VFDVDVDVDVASDVVDVGVDDDVDIRCTMLDSTSQTTTRNHSTPFQHQRNIPNTCTSEHCTLLTTHHTSHITNINLIKRD